MNICRKHNVAEKRHKGGKGSYCPRCAEEAVRPVRR